MRNILVERANRYFYDDQPTPFTVTLNGIVKPIFSDNSQEIYALEQAALEAEKQFGTEWESVQNGLEAVTRVEWVSRAPLVTNDDDLPPKPDNDTPETTHEENESVNEKISIIPTIEKVKEVVAAADRAFWETVNKAFPQVVDGGFDMPTLAKDFGNFKMIEQQIVQRWLEHNWPQD